jgi:hypothetical protein
MAWDQLEMQRTAVGAELDTPEQQSRGQAKTTTLIRKDRHSGHHRITDDAFLL